MKSIIERTKNPFVRALLTDLYQLTMLYGYWKSGRYYETSSFDLFFRRNPFGGEYTVFAGLEDVLDYFETFRFTDRDIKYLKTLLPDADPKFFTWLRRLDCSELTVDAIQEGKIVFPKIPLYRVSGPLGLANLVETTMLNQTNFASLVTTQAARMRIAAGWDAIMLEFGLRRAQGADGAMSASKYAYMGTFNGTSNVEAGRLYDIPVKGTHAHSWVMSFKSLDQIIDRQLKHAFRDKSGDFVECVLKYRRGNKFQRTNEGELAAFIQYAMLFPNSFLALIDTYDTLRSGLPNFICVALALVEFGYLPIGVRIDSGDLAYYSKEIHAEYAIYEPLRGCAVVASNDIDEATLYALKEQGHRIDSFGIGTCLVTCADQPALGGVYKLTEVDGQPRMKFSNAPEKNTIPGEKIPYRLYYGGKPVCDLMILSGEAAPEVGQLVTCCHPFDQLQRMAIKPDAVEKLHWRVWQGKRIYAFEPLSDRREKVISGLRSLPDDLTRRLNPRPYKVSVSPALFELTKNLREREASLEVLS